MIEKMMNDIENIIVEDEFIIIITTGGDRRTIRIDNVNTTHKQYVVNILSMADSLVDEIKPDITDGTSDSIWPSDDYGDVDYNGDDVW